MSFYGFFTPQFEEFEIINNRHTIKKTEDEEEKEVYQFQRSN